MGRRIAVRAIIIDGKKLFCVRHKAYGGKSERTFWCTPGGGVDKGEDLVSALKREIIEEIGVQPKVGGLLYIQQYKDKEDNNEHIEFFFNVRNVNDFKGIDICKASLADIEIEEFDFVAVDRGSNILPKFLKSENITEHIKNKKPTKVFHYNLKPERSDLS